MIMNAKLMKMILLLHISVMEIVQKKLMYFVIMPLLMLNIKHALLDLHVEMEHLSVVRNVMMVIVMILMDVKQIAH